MKANKLKELTTEKLTEKLAKARAELIELQFDVRVGQEKDYSTIARKRKDVARMITVLMSIDGKESTKTEEKKETVKKKPEATKKADKAPAQETSKKSGKANSRINSAKSETKEKKETKTKAKKTKK